MEELTQKAQELIKNMFDKGMTLNEIADLLADIATKEEFKRFIEKQER